MNTNTDALRAQLESETRLAPGEAGWWKVWGASPADIRAGDIVVTKGDDDGLVYDEVATASTESLWVRCTDPAGKVFTFGRLFRGLVLFRQGTGNTLAGSVR